MHVIFNSIINMHGQSHDATKHWHSPNNTWTINSFLWQDPRHFPGFWSIFLTFPWELSNSRTFPGFPMTELLTCLLRGQQQISLQILQTANCPSKTKNTRCQSRLNDRRHPACLLQTTCLQTTIFLHLQPVKKLWTADNILLYYRDLHSVRLAIEKLWVPFPVGDCCAVALCKLFIPICLCDLVLV